MYNNAVTTTNLSKQYGRQMVLNNVSIQVKPGQIYGLVGNNGAGKTTLLRILSGLTIEKSGEYTIFDESEYSKKNEARRRVASLIEEPGFFPFMTARQNLLVLVGSSSLHQRTCVIKQRMQRCCSQTGRIELLLRGLQRCTRYTRLLMTYLSPASSVSSQTKKRRP